MSTRMRNLLSRGFSRSRRPKVPPGERWYAIGDVHGRLDLLAALITAIDADDAASFTAETTVVLLGDLVDRGPDSAGVIAAVSAWQARRTVRCIAGNHEEMFLASFCDAAVLREFLRHGGRETLASYGIEASASGKADLSLTQQAMQRLIPADDHAFLSAMEDHVIAGNYLMVHAGIRPDRPLEEQTRADKRWIREPFLRHEGPFGHVVVHGHTIGPAVFATPHRIGIDTGAFRTGRLTALVLEGDRRRVIQAVAASDGQISMEKGDKI